MNIISVEKIHVSLQQFEDRNIFWPQYKFTLNSQFRKILSFIIVL